MSKKVKSSAIGVGSNVAIEIPLRDGSVSLVTGRIEKRTKGAIVLSSAAFVKDTGRRTEFFAGRFDANCEIEVYPEDVQLEIPAQGCLIYSWPHALPRAMR
jgi:hypothetical protein